jgi:hypothetical protein
MVLMLPRRTSQRRDGENHDRNEERRAKVEVHAATVANRNGSHNADTTNDSKSTTNSRC